jgi:hypothetical protein
MHDESKLAQARSPEPPPWLYRNTGRESGAEGANYHYPVPLTTVRERGAPSIRRESIQRHYSIATL